MQPDTIVRRQPLGPVISKIDKPRVLASCADALVEAQGLADREIVRSRMRPNLLELADVAVLLLLGRKERPQSGDLVAANVEHSRAVRGTQPLVQARGVVVASKVAELEIQMGEGMRPIDDDRNAILAGHRDHITDWADLPRDVDYVAHEDHPRLGRDVLLEEADNLAEVLAGEGNLELLERNAVPPLHLLKRGDHPRIVLRGRQDLVASFQLEPVL